MAVSRARGGSVDGLAAVTAGCANILGKALVARVLVLDEATSAHGGVRILTKLGFTMRLCQPLGLRLAARHAHAMTSFETAKRLVVTAASW